MPYKCFKCIETFESSGQMVQHMKEQHSSFVEDAQMKIDRSQESSFEAKRAIPGNSITAATCPFCKKDCKTRKKLMRHLEIEHNDEDADQEPQLKIVRLENDSKDKLFKKLDKEVNTEAELAAKKVNIVNKLLTNIGPTEGTSKVALPGTSDTIEVSTTSIKIAERRYRCFWCDATFRKRGKLMDHIDMFHKANKLQSEEEAELLHVTVYTTVPAPKENATKKLTSTPSQEKKQSISEKKSNAQTEKKSNAQTEKKSNAQADKKLNTLVEKKSNTEKKLNAPATAVRSNSKNSLIKKQSNNSTSEYTPVTSEWEEIPYNHVCIFKLVGSITEVSRIKSKETLTNNVTGCCTFFNKKDNNPLPPIATKWIDNSPLPPTVEERNELKESSTMDTKLQQSLTTDAQPVNHIPIAPPTYMHSMQRRHSMTHYQRNNQYAFNSPLSPTYLHLARPQPIHPMLNPRFQAYQQHMAQQLYWSHQQQQQQMRIAEYQQHRHNGCIPQRFHNPDHPLDLTLSKFY